jgi:SAM-dependent methyltransferase
MIDARTPVNRNQPVGMPEKGPPPAIPRNPIARLVRSLRHFGLSYTLRTGRRHLSGMISRVRDAGFDDKLGTDTSGFVEIPEMTDVESENRERGIRYEPTRAVPFGKILSKAGVPRDGAFLDVGSGKGRMLILAAEYGFAHVAGVDFSPSLCEIARRNLEHYGREHGTPLSWDVVCADAARYRPGENVSVVYMYNPFDNVVMAGFLDGLEASLEASPRPLWIVYHNAVCHALVVSRGFEVLLERSFGGCDFTVYRRGGEAR